MEAEKFGRLFFDDCKDQALFFRVVLKFNAPFLQLPPFKVRK